MTPEEQLDEARAKEAQLLWESGQEAGSSSWVVAARLAREAAEARIAELEARIAELEARENWTPPEPVDPDLLAYREWIETSPLTPRPSGDPNRYDDVLFEAYRAGARMARERERAKVRVVEYAKEHAPFTHRAPAKYRGEA